MYISRIFLLLCSVTLVFSQGISEPPNIGKLKLSVKNYIESGSYATDIQKVYTQARSFIEENMKEGVKYAVVMDIDETTLSNMEYEERYQYGFSMKTWNEWIQEEKAKAIPAAKEFYDWGISKGITFFFVTGRKQYADSLEADPTVKNMHTEGFTKYGKLYLKPSVKGLETVVYKAGARKEITEQGYVILASIGDQFSDLKGGYAASVWKIPNPMYFVD